MDGGRAHNAANDFADFSSLCFITIKLCMDNSRVPGIKSFMATRLAGNNYM